MTVIKIKDVIEAASASLTVYDRTGGQHAAWAREHGGKLLDAARALLVRAEKAEAASARLREALADAASALVNAQNYTRLGLARIRHAGQKRPMPNAAKGAEADG